MGQPLEYPCGLITDLIRGLVISLSGLPLGTNFKFGKILKSLKKSKNVKGLKILRDLRESDLMGTREKFFKGFEKSAKLSAEK